MLAIMSQLPSVNQTSWGSGRSQMSNLSVSDVGSFDEEKLDEILPPEFSAANSAFIMNVEVHAESQAESDCEMRYGPIDESLQMDASCSSSCDGPSKVYDSSNNDVVDDQINSSGSLLMNSLSFPKDNDVSNFSQDSNMLDAGNQAFSRSNYVQSSSSLLDDDTLDQTSSTISHHNYAQSAKHGDSSYPPISSVDVDSQENDPLTDLDTMSTSQSIGSSLATDSKKRFSSSDTEYGRWTPEEHEAFLQGLLQHGREWKKVAENIPTRTSSQIRSHAQKYFAKLARDEQQKALALNRSLVSTLVPVEAATQILPPSSSSQSAAASYSQSPLTPSAQVWVERILVNPDAVQREVEERLGRLRARYRELQIAMEQRQRRGNGLNESVHRRDSSSSSESSSSPNTTDVDCRRLNMRTLIPDLPHTLEEGGMSSVARSLQYPQVEPLQLARVQNPFTFQHHLQNSMAVLRRKRLCSDRTVPSISSFTRVSDSLRDERGRSTAMEYTSQTFPSPATSSVDGRTLGNEELIALEVLGGDLRRNSSADNLTLSTTHESLGSTWNANVMEGDDEKCSTNIMASSNVLEQKAEGSNERRNAKKRRWSEDCGNDCLKKDV
jgi:SHAQKYF class myb-like DNA-binding protein